MSSRLYGKLQKIQSICVTAFQKRRLSLYAITSCFLRKLRLRFPVLVVKYAQKVEDRVGATELIIKLKPKVIERFKNVIKRFKGLSHIKLCRCVLWKCRRLTVKEIWLL